MRHSSIFQHLMQQPLTEARKEARQEGHQEGHQEGRQEGRQEGIQEGIQLGVDNLIDVLDARFQDQDVDLYKPIFEAITDLQLLRRLFHTALSAPTFDDVMQTLRDYRKNGGA